MRKLVLRLLASLSVLVVGYFAISMTYRAEKRTGPVSTIGKSGEMKSPGGQPSAPNGT